MGPFLLLFLVLLPILGSFPVYPLRDYDRTWRNHYVRLLPALELAAALMLPGSWACPSGQARFLFGQIRPDGQRRKRTQKPCARGAIWRTM